MGVYMMTRQSILVVNTKGGCGKSTIATNLASYYARIGLRTGLHDGDLQRSSELWLDRRPDSLPKIRRLRRWDDRDTAADFARIIIDAPGGIGVGQLGQMVSWVDTIVIPVLPSYIDMAAAAGFIGKLLVKLHLDISTKSVCVIANRVRSNTHSYEKLMKFLKNLRIPFVAALRDSQNYVRAYECGAGIWDMRASRVVQDLEQLRKLMNWIERPQGETVWERAMRLTQSPTDDREYYSVRRSATLPNHLARYLRRSYS